MLLAKTPMGRCLRESPSLGSEHLPASRNLELTLPKITKFLLFWLWLRATGSGVSWGCQPGVIASLHPPGVGTDEKVLWMSAGDAEGWGHRSGSPQTPQFSPPASCRGAGSGGCHCKPGLPGGGNARRPKRGELMSLLQRTGSSLLPFI